MKALKGGWKEIPILSGSDATTLITIAKIKENEEIVLFDGNKYINGNAGSVTEQGAPWDLSEAGDTGINYDISAQTSSPAFVRFSSNGSTMYVVGGSEKTIFQYELERAWDVSSAKFSKEFSLNSELTQDAPQGLFFSPDGKKMYVSEWTTGKIYQYNLTTPWDVSTANYANVTFSLASQTTQPAGLFFSPDGTKFWVGDIKNSSILQYNLSTPWDLSTASYSNKSFSIQSQDSPRDLAFSVDGTKMFVFGGGNKQVYQYNLSEPWDVSSATYSGVAFKVTGSYGMCISSDGCLLYTIDSGTDKVYQYSLFRCSIDISSFSLSTVPQKAFKKDFPSVWVSIPFEQEETDNDWYQYQVTVTEKLKEIKVLSGSDKNTLKTMDEVVTGEKVILYNSVDGVKEGEIEGVSLNESHISEAVLEISKDISSVTDFPNNVFFSSDGQYMYITSPSTDTNKIYQFRLSNPWDISSFNKIAEMDFLDPTAIFFKEDGTAVFIYSQDKHRLNKFTLTTPWDITSRVSAGYKDFSSDSANAFLGMFFNTEGNMLFVSEGTTKSIRLYNLSVPWDVTTMSYSGVSLDMSSFFNPPHQLFFSPNGKKLFVTGHSGSKIVEFSLSKPWDITTAKHTTTVSVEGESSLNGLFFSSDGHKMFVVSEYPNNVVLQYSLPDSVYPYYQSDISSFNLTNPPQRAWKEPTKVYVAMESTPDRCLWKDKDISDKIQNATTNSFELAEDLSNILKVGDELIVNGNTVQVTSYDITNDFALVFSEDGNTRHNFSSVLQVGFDVYVGAESCMFKFDKFGNLKKAVVLRDDTHNCYITITSMKYFDGYIYAIGSDNHNLGYYLKINPETLEVVIAKDSVSTLTDIEVYEEGIFVCGYESGDSADYGFIRKLNHNLMFATGKRFTGGNIRIYDIYLTHDGITAVGYEKSNGRAIYITSDLNLINVSYQQIYYGTSVQFSSVAPGKIVTGDRLIFDSVNTKPYIYYLSDLNNTVRISKLSTNGDKLIGAGYFVESSTQHPAIFDFNEQKLLVITASDFSQVRDIHVSNNCIAICGYSSTEDYLILLPLDFDKVPSSITVGEKTVYFSLYTPSKQQENLNPNSHDHRSYISNDSASFDSINTDILSDSTVFNVGGKPLRFVVTVPEQSSTITSVIIPQRTEPQTLQYRTYLSDQDVIKSRYQAVNKKGRALRIKLEGIEDTYVNNFKIDLWTGE